MPRKPVWSEGVLVSQHHFQQADLYHERCLNARTQALQAYGWGLTHLDIDQSALNSNHFRIAELEAIWPNGTVVSWGKGRPHATPSGRDFTEALNSSHEGLDVYLALPTPSEGGASLARSHEPRGDRQFLETELSVSDRNSGRSPITIQWAQPNVRILFGEEPRDGTEAIRVAQLIRESSGRVIVRDNSVPPSLHLSVAPFILSGLNRLLSAMGAKQKELKRERTQRKIGSVDLAAASARSFWLLHTISGAQPRLTHYSQSGKSHPEALYLELCGLLGQLASFSASVEVEQAPPFDYQNLGGTFEPLYARILSHISAKVEKPYVEIELTRRAEDGMYLGKIRDTSLLKQELFIAVHSSQEESIVRDRIPGLMKVASWQQIYVAVKQSRRGLRLDVEWNPSAALPIRPGTIFFRLQKEGSFWDDIRASSTIALSLPNEQGWQKATLSLYAIDARHLA